MSRKRKMGKEERNKTSKEPREAGREKFFLRQKERETLKEKGVRMVEECLQ